MFTEQLFSRHAHARTRHGQRRHGLHDARDGSGLIDDGAGLAFFYCGLVRTKNVLATMMQVFMTVAVVCLIWMIYGYSLAFTAGAGRRLSSATSPKRFSSA